MKAVNQAVSAVRAFLFAYKRGDQRGGSMNWEDLDYAHEIAKDFEQTAAPYSQRIVYTPADYLEVGDMLVYLPTRPPAKIIEIRDGRALLDGGPTGGIGLESNVMYPIAIFF